MILHHWWMRVPWELRQAADECRCRSYGLFILHYEKYCMTSDRPLAFEWYSVNQCVWWALYVYGNMEVWNIWCQTSPNMCNMPVLSENANRFCIPCLLSPFPFWIQFGRVELNRCRCPCGPCWCNSIKSMEMGKMSALLFCDGKGAAHPIFQTGPWRRSKDLYNLLCFICRGEATPDPRPSDSFSFKSILD